MNIREIDLPGIGKKFEIHTKSKEKIVIIIHDDGRREIYYFNKNDYDDFEYTITLDDAESRQISAILGGVIYRPKQLEEIDMVFDDLVIEWYKVESCSDAINKTIGELDIRQSYKVTVIAIIRKSKDKVVNPGSDSIIKEGDTLIISGEKKELREFKKNLLQKGDT